MLILVRHAHRDKTQGRARDNGLSEKGRKQAAIFEEHWEKKLAKRKPAFLSSPKRRCTQTVAGLAAKLNCRVRVSPLLDEQHELLNESYGKFRGRVKRFLTWWEKEGPDCLVACSHGDWIPEFLKLTRGKPKELSKGEWIVLDR
jgi:broad specificity phosphatase PhoE